MNDITFSLAHQCGKVPYEHRDLARMALAKLRARNFTIKGRVEPYLCPRCGKFHLGRQGTINPRRKHK